MLCVNTRRDEVMAKTCNVSYSFMGGVGYQGGVRGSEAMDHNQGVKIVKARAYEVNVAVICLTIYSACVV